MTTQLDAKLMNKIFRDELAAAGTYARILESGAKYPGMWGLWEIAEAHRQAAGRLAQEIDALGEESDDEAPEGSTIWRGVARDRQRKLSEDRRLLIALRDREARAAQQGLWALKQENSPPARELLSEHIVPMLERHVDILDGLL